VIGHGETSSVFIYRLNPYADRNPPKRNPRQTEPGWDRSRDASRRDTTLAARVRRPHILEPSMTPIPLYASAITDAIAGGDLDQLRKLQALAESHLEEHGDIGALLAQLKVEIAKLKR
jgi:hypothetical protein